MKALTKKDLEDFGLEISQNDGYYKIIRHHHKTNSLRMKTTTEVKIIKSVRSHPYGKDKVYEIIAFSNKNKTVSIPLARAIYAWFIGDIPANYDVDHKDNNSMNNSLDNLQLLTRKQNLAKRFQDNSVVKVNKVTYKEGY
jgi:hypothetical protein